MDKFNGEISFPGLENWIQTTVVVNDARTSAHVDFADNEDGLSQIDSEKFSFIIRPKYNEIIFTTSGIPIEDVELIWKLNESHADGTVAGVVIAQPNSHKITGEKGFILESINS